MAATIQMIARDDHIDTLTDSRNTNDDILQMTEWWNTEYQKARKAKPWNVDPAQSQWEKAVERVERDTRGADPDAQYNDNHWFWNTALLKLAIYLQAEKSKPSPMSLFIEAFEETVDERVQDARTLIQDAGEVANDAITSVSKAAEAISSAGETAWSGLKTAAIIGGGLLGAAIVVPPLIRAMRD